MLDDRAWLIILIPVNLLTLVVITWRFRGSGLCGVFPRWSSVYVNFNATAKWLLFMSPPHPLHRQLKDMADKRLSEQVVWGCPRILCFAFCYNMVQLVQNDMSSAARLGNMALTTFLMAGTLKPRLLTPTIVFLFHVLLYIVVLYLAITAENSVAFLKASPVRICERIAVSIVHCRPRLTLVLGLVYTAAVAPVYDPADIRQELIVSLLIFAITASVRKSRDAEFLAMLEAKTSRSVESTAGGLLSSVCDAVVHLSHDFLFSKPAAHLATLLLRSPKTMGVGVSFVDLAFDASEKDRVITFLKQSMSDTSTVHVSLKDSWGMPVNFQLFHAQGINIDDEPIHIVGLKEDSDFLRAPPESELRDSPVVSPADRFAGISEDSISFSGSFSSRVPIGTHSAGMTVHINPGVDGLPILQCSPEFLSLSGPICEGAGLLPWVINKRAFMNWAKVAYNNIMDDYEFGDGAKDKKPGMETFNIRLKLPHMGLTVREISANAVLRLDFAEDQGSDVTSSPRILLVLEDVFCVRRRSSSKRRCQESLELPAILTL
ncbi:unnamed protein product [Prorocentrum cordatum]|uniref:Uncharacterized protein n=1 Tax=Prorocentrum cordatum TaxID=2364126 RepID=A0ABN9TFZ6_9DINO|nr:unnamed protein product [Polarella glacialis]